MKILNFDQVIKEIQPHLEEYLEEKGFDTERNFSCINPKHGDSSPSMSLIKPEAKRVYCHGCGWTGDIFDVVGVLEEKPLASSAFIKDTVEMLAEKYGVKVNKTELTEDEIYELDTFRAYKYTAEYLSSWEDLPDDILKEFEGRGWTEDHHETIRSMGIGYIKDFSEFREYLKGKGFTASFLDDVDLGRKSIFSPGHLIYTIKDEHGHPVGFASKDLHRKGKEYPKYINQKSTGAKCNIYQKGKRLYNFDQALRDRFEGPLYIVEGYSDVVTCVLNGFRRVVATCGTALTDDHIFLLKEHGIRNVVLCLDGDDPGQKRTEGILDKRFSKHKDVNVKIVNLTDDLDPDEYIRKYGLSAFLNIPQWTAFQWRLNRIDEDEDPEIICQKMMPFVTAEPSPISQEKMLHDLARYTGFTLKVLQQELNRLNNEKERERDLAKRTIVDKLVHDLKKPGSDHVSVLNMTIQHLHSVEAKYNQDSFSIDSTLKFLKDIKQEQEELSGDAQGFHLGPDLVDMERVVLNGNYRKDVLLVFGGKANTGKTSLMCKIAYSMAKYNEDVCAIYLTIDDTAEQVFPKFITMAAPQLSVQINEIKNPNYYKEVDGLEVYNEIMESREAGYSEVVDLVEQGKLVLKDANDGSSIGFINSLIQYYQDKYPERQVVFFLDNFHKLQDFQDMKDERVRFKALSTAVKSIATSYHIPIFSTMEYTKLARGERPSNNNIAETVQMEYDANLICHLWNEQHELQDQCSESRTHVHADRSGASRMPVIEMIVGKNKISSFKSSIYYKFFPPYSEFQSHSLEEMASTTNNNRNNTQPRALFG